MLCERVLRLVRRYTTVPGVVVIFACTYCLVLAMEAGEPGAAWVQAVGSIVAIAVAIAISRSEGNRQFRSQIEEQYLYMEKAYKVSAYAVETISGAARSILGRNNRLMVRYDYDLLGIALQDMEQITYADIEDGSVAVAWLNVKRSVALARLSIEPELVGDPSAVPNVKGRVDLWTEHAERDLDNMSRGIVEFAGRYPFLLDLIEL
ncbi:hypothetical protein [Pseudomonas citronellolis]|uniref:hypothetical protein n=1 Tax=Pseudomonas citronellolis TaxID=53408 RepID=UPI000E2E6DCB|nr:hypothetical protein [Pseudomonas citronellolis]